MFSRWTTILPLVAGWMFTYYNTKRTDERKAQIERVNDQVKLLYGPLLACVHATRAAYSAMVKQHSPNGTVEGFQKARHDNPSGAEGQAYRKWMKEVLQPLNQKAKDVIVNFMNLLDTPTVHPLLLQLVAHVSAYSVILKRWEEGAVDEWSVVPYPDKLLEHVEREFLKVKKKQADLLGLDVEGRAVTEAVRSKL
ncbi:hypothetical protein N2152v2_009416 [Parachlorella kessleri]